MDLICIFAGEVGGLMGLMLGASVMTVCELVDLLIYNGIIKCLNKKRVKPGEEETIEGDGDDVIKCKAEPHITHT